MSDNRVKVIGYSQRVFYDDGIEYRNFSDNLVGQQFVEDGGTALFTLGNFKVETNIDPRITRSYNMGKFSPFFNFETLNLTPEDEELIIESSKLKLNLDKADLRNYAYYGSLIEFIRVNLEEVIINWPASLYCNSEIPDSIVTGNTIIDYSYNTLEETSTFKVVSSNIRNQFEINYLTNGEILDSFSDSNDLRNLTVNYASYVLTINENDYKILDFTGATSTSDSHLNFKISGNPLSSSTSSEEFHIRPSMKKREGFFNYLPDFQSHLLNRLVTPQYTGNFRFPVRTDSGVVLYKEEKYTWPTTDGYNIDFDTTQYETYVTQLLKIGTNYDENLSNYMVRFLVSESISDFDSVRRSDGEVEETASQKMNKTLKIYGREFDEIKRKVDGIKYANTVTYDKKNNTPDVILKNIARTLGWELTSSMIGNDLINNYLEIQESSYSGESRGLTPLEAEYELWRRLILNSPWIWKSKGTRKAIEFLFRFIGAPEGLISLNEYLYVADGKIDVETFKLLLERQNLDTDTNLYNIDTEGYPKAFDNTSEMYFQKGGSWYRETGGSGSTKHILEGNNPHVGPYDGGKAWKGQFETLIPNFSAVTITEETITTGTTNIFTNYNSGFFNNLIDETIYVDLIDTSSAVNNFTTQIIDDPIPSIETTDCGCETGIEDRSLLIDYDISNQSSFTTIINPKLGSGAFFMMEDDETCTLNVKFDYLFKFDCNDLISLSSVTEVFEGFTVYWGIETVSGGTSSPVYEEVLFDIDNLVDYVRDNENTGIYLSGNNCDAITQRLINEFGDDCDLINDTTFNSDWVKLNHVFSDATILSAITNQKVVISLRLINTVTNYGVLLDRIELNQGCVEVQRVDSTITTSPGFELIKTPDNKKSWVNSDDPATREFDLRLRDTRYKVDNHKLVINNKEIELNFDYAKPIECDLFSYYTQSQFQDNFYSGNCVGFQTTPSNTNIYVFYDGTSLDNSDGSQASISINAWYNQFKIDNPDYEGNLYELGVGASVNNGENWMAWSTYPWLGTLTGSSANTFGDPRQDAQPELNDGVRFSYLNYANTLPPGATPVGSTIVNSQGDTAAGPAAWSGGDENYIVIIVADESDQTVGGYYDSTNYIQTGSTRYPFFNTIDDYVEPTPRFTEEYNWFLNTYQQLNFFKGFIYPVVNARASTALMLNHVAGAIEGEIIDRVNTDAIPLNDNANSGTYNYVYDAPQSIVDANPDKKFLISDNPYVTLLNSSGYTSLPTDLQNGTGLKNFGWGVDYNVSDFSEEQFALSLNNFLLGTEFPVITVGQTGTTNPTDFLSIDQSNVTLTYGERLHAYSTELIDVKSRKIMQGYPLLRKVYDDYNDVNLREISKSPLNYSDTIGFGKLVDNFWVDLVEQVMPSTAMWDSTYVYRNSIFDAAKMQYKRYTLFNGNNLGNLPFNPIAVSENVELITLDISDIDGSPECAQIVTTTGDSKNVAIAQMDSSSEFYGSITVVGTQTINVCDLIITDVNRLWELQSGATGGVATMLFTTTINSIVVVNVTLPIVSYYWEITAQSNGAIIWSSTESFTSEYIEIPMGSNGNAEVNGSVTIIDSNGCQATELLNLQNYTVQI